MRDKGTERAESREQRRQRGKQSSERCRNTAIATTHDDEQKFGSHTHNSMAPRTIHTGGSRSSGGGGAPATTQAQQAVAGVQAAADAAEAALGAQAPPAGEAADGGGDAERDAQMAQMAATIARLEREQEERRRSQEMREHIQRLMQESKKNRGRSPGGRKRKYESESSSEEEEDEVRTPKSKSSKSKRERWDSSEDEREGIKTVKDVEERMRLVEQAGYTLRLSGNRHAEMRRCLTWMWGIAHVHRAEVKEDPEHKSVAAELAMEALDKTVTLLLEYEKAGPTQDSSMIAARIQRIDAELAKTVGRKSKKVGAKAKEWMPVPGGVAQTGGRYSSYNKNSYAYGQERPTAAPKESERDREVRMMREQQEAMRAQLMAMQAGMGNPHQGFAQSASSMQQAAFAATLPTQNAQFGRTTVQAAAATPAAAVPLPGGARPGAPMCYNCQLYGHIARNCPTIPQQQAPAASQQNNPVSEEGERGRGGGREREMPSEACPIWAVAETTRAETHPAPIMGVIPVPANRASKEREEQCSCGICAGCEADIDVMQKEAREQRVALAPAKDPAAGEIERKQRAVLEAIIAEIGPDENYNTQMTDAQREIAREWYYWKRREAWQAGGEGEAEGKAEERGEGAPQRAAFKLGEMMKGLEGKKVFKKHEEGRWCYWCKRKGHSRGSCMTAPAEEREREGTEEQKEKQRFVLELLRKGKAPTVEELMEQEGSRKGAVEKAMRLGEEANRGNPWEKSEKRRDKLRKRLGYWWAIGADKVILSWIGFGVKIKFEVQPERVCFPNHKSYYEEVAHIRAEHDLHIQDGSFREAEGEEVHVGNPMQVEVNAKGKRRMCVDMRYTNAHLADYSFTQETLNRHVARIVERDMQMITTDVAKAYYQVPLHKDSQRYCGWRHEGKWIVPTILVFGLSVAPFVFTKIMRAVLTFARAMNIRGSNCIDDNLWAAEEGEILEVREIVQLVFGRLGWQFNEKCEFDPSTTVLYNGMWVDSKRFEIRATDEKVEAARKLAWTLWYAARDGEQVGVKDLQRLTGRLQSMRLALEGVAVWTRGLYADIARALDEQTWKTHLRPEALADLAFWAHRLGKQNGLPIPDKGSEVHVDITISSDASDIGYGAHVDGNRTGVSGLLPVEFLGESSTAREIKGVLMAAEQMKGELRGRRVRIRMDSHPAICNFISGGGPVLELNRLVREWWVWCKKNRVTPLYEWVPREQNQTADDLSKEHAGEHTLTEEAERRVRGWLEEQGLPGVRASYWNRTTIRVPRLDGVAIRLEEMRRARRPGCIVVPDWRAAPWRAELRKNSAATMRIGRIGEVLKQTEEVKREHAHHSWTMEAWIVTQGGRG